MFLPLENVSDIQIFLLNIRQAIQEQPKCRATAQWTVEVVLVETVCLDGRKDGRQEGQRAKGKDDRV